MKRNTKLLLILLAVMLGMFAFGYANVPLFKLFCSAVGINVSQPSEMAAKAAVDSAATSEDTSREVKVLFTTTVSDNLPIVFESDKSRADMHPGGMDEVHYRFVNLSDDTLYFRPVHSVYPAEANDKYTMIKCFCFKDMILAPHEEVTHPLLFSIHKDLDPSITRLTMHYTLFRRDPKAADWNPGVMQKLESEK